MYTIIEKGVVFLYFKALAIIAATTLLTSCSNTEKQQLNINNTEIKEQTATINNAVKTTEEITTEQTTELDTYTQQLLDLINAYRNENNVCELEYDYVLEECAQIRCNEAISTWSHTRPDGSTCFTVKEHYYRGENLGRGYNTPEEVFNGWVSSETHNANLLEQRFTTIGIYYITTEKGTIWTAGFGCN